MKPLNVSPGDEFYICYVKYWHLARVTDPKEFEWLEDYIALEFGGIRMRFEWKNLDGLLVPANELTEALYDNNEIRRW